jgi:hypothetical protein
MKHLKSIWVIAAISLICMSCKGRDHISHNIDSMQEDSLLEVNETIMSEDDYTAIMQNQVKRIIASVRQRDALEFASLCRYPIERDYPLRDVTDSADMVARYDEIFDSEIRNAVLATNADDWGGINWRGYTFDDGSWIWLDDCVYRIPYHSDFERKNRKILIKKDLATLPSELAKGWYPELCLLDTVSGTVYRIDVRELDSAETECRLIKYGKEDALDSIPSFILTGNKELQGTASTRCYIFHRDNGLDWTVCNFWYENKITLYVDDKEELSESIDLKKVYWLDIIAQR